MALSNKIGVDFLLYVNTAGGDGVTPPPTWVKVGGQRGATLNRSRETIDTTTKDTGGFKGKDTGYGEWGIDADGLFIESDAGLKELEDAFMNGDKIFVHFKTAAGTKYQGMCVLTDFPIEAPHDGEVTYSLTLEGDGAPTKITTP